MAQRKLRDDKADGTAHIGSREHLLNSSSWLCVSSFESESKK